MSSNYYVYILTNFNNTTLYIGVTNNLIRRIYEHREKLVPGFSNRYNLTKLVYYEIFSDPTNAITREKQLKHWKQEWKKELICKNNREWLDLYTSIL